MLLCIDIGNSNIVLGTYKSNQLLNTYRIKTSLHETADGYGIIINNLLIHDGYTPKDIEGIIISSVVPALDITFERVCTKYFNKKPLFVIPGIKSGINIKLDNPKQLGADLLVGAVSVVNKYQTPAIIIDMGTAITLTVVNEKNEFLGGIIYPGIKTSFSNLTEKTSKLEDARLVKVTNIIGRDTVSCIQSGMLFGTSSMIDGTIRKIKKLYPSAIVVLTGGESRLIESYLEEEVIIDDNLLLDGLNILYWKNSERV